MLGIALEGGGAKGAFHIGAIQACMEMGLYPPNAIAGTSIGAMNAAMVAQGDFERAKTLWENITSSDIFTSNDDRVINASIKQLNFEGVADWATGFRSLLNAGGIDNSNMKAIIDENIDVNKLMESPIDFGIVTFELNHFKAVEVFKDEMGAEHIPTYILASAAFPGFKKVTLGDNFFIDGGVYDNCPVNMLLDRGCEKVIAVRTNAVGITRYDEKDPRVITISPSEDLGSLMKFSTEKAQHNMKLGYYDGLRALMELEGDRYYFTDTEIHGIDNMFYLADETIDEMAQALRISRRNHPQRLFFERILPVLFDDMDLTHKDGYQTLIVRLIEDRAKRCGIERLTLYTAEELLAKGMAATPLGRQKGVDKACDLLLSAVFD